MSMSGTEIDLIIKGGIVTSASSAVAADIAIDKGVVVAVGKEQALPAAREFIDANGLHVIPGAIDVHVHFREPGFSHKETWLSGTQAAAVGGITTVFDMPNTNPPTRDLVSLELKRSIIEPQAIIDYGIYGLIGEDNHDQLEPMVKAGAISFKLYMGSENPLVPCPSDGAIVEAFERLASLRIRCTVHAENTPILQWRGERLKKSGRTDEAAHLEQHIDLADVEAVSRTALFSEWTGCKVHIAHESSRFAIPVIANAKARGVRLTAETCPHYLYLSTDDQARLGSNFLRVKPPVREPGHAEPLWKALSDGTIDIISTDHAPHLIAEKQRSSIWETAPGFPGVETSMRLMLTAVNAGRISLCDYVRMACEVPAKAFGIFPRKGAIQVGSDSDIVLIDLKRQSKIEMNKLHSIGRATPFDGFLTKGLPIMTLVRGKRVAKDGEAVGVPGWGKLVRAAL
jgi:dihydroorotase